MLESGHLGRCIWILSVRYSSLAFRDEYKVAAMKRRQILDIWLKDDKDVRTTIP